ncbi:phage baseplate assembly protein V [Amycolatopsis sp. cmx-4-61]|uniref:phage baseplate assembly protein V n=1 Tax=Amycolatopsis sp. cmx-4-61 TaxID=2790937 RepID=UPI00397D318F
MTAAPTTSEPVLLRVTPAVSVRGRPLPPDAADRLEHVVVDTHAHRPDMFEITFLDNDGSALSDAGLAIGSLVTISSASAASADAVELITGEVTALEGAFDDVARTVVRGYTTDHRLQRARRNRTFVNCKDSDIARRIASEHKLKIGRIDQTRATHPHVGQVNQTDWDFLRDRATALGYDVGVRDGQFFFTRAVQAKRARPVAMSYPGTLRSFRPRITAGNLTPSTEVRVWNPAKATTESSVVATAAASVSVPDADPVKVANTFKPAAPPKKSKPAPALAKAGPSPLANGFVVATVPAGDVRTAQEYAAGLAEHVGSTVAEAEGETVGDPRLRSGATLDISGVGATFSGRWVITRSTHLYQTTGYVTRFEVSGRHERSLLGLNNGGGVDATPRIPGVACGIVSNIGDPENLGRVRVALPWLAPDFESDWAVVAQPGAGPSSGIRLVPQVGDQVLVGFEFGDPRRPYVISGLYTDQSVNGLGGEPVKKSGQAASVVWRGISTPAGSRLAFHDEVTPGRRPRTIACDFVLGTKNADLALVVDKVKGTVTLRCVPKPDGKPAPPGKLTIECGDQGTIDIRTGKGGTVNIDAGAQLNVKAKAGIELESSGVVQIKGNPIKLN